MKDTIAAIATGGGISAISIIRISGENALKIAKKIVKTEKDELKPRYFYLGSAITKDIKDEVMLVYFKKPNSYTGEDACEIHCHGNQRIAQSILRECILLGARLANSGEFTLRAFLNGKLDLTEAEAVHELIFAESDSEINSAYLNLKGELFNIISKLQKELIKNIASAEVIIDFPDEDIENQKKEELKIYLDKLIKKLSNLAETYHGGRFIKDGIMVAIIGEPNVGKSMLLNALLKEDRAIVTSEEGTTRDTLEEMFFIDGQKYIIIDTAGIRETDNTIEILGIDRSYRAMERADIILAISEVNKKFKIDIPQNKEVIFAINKADLLSENEIKSNKNSIYISAKTGYNIEKLKQLLSQHFHSKTKSYNGHVLSNVRHYNALKDAIKMLVNAQCQLDYETMDCILSDLNAAYRALGRITGIFSNEQILDEIFSNFCVGK